MRRCPSDTTGPADSQASDVGAFVAVLFADVIFDWEGGGIGSRVLPGGEDGDEVQGGFPAAGLRELKRLACLPLTPSRPHCCFCWPCLPLPPLPELSLALYPAAAAAEPYAPYEIPILPLPPYCPPGAKPNVTAENMEYVNYPNHPCMFLRNAASWETASALA